MNRAALESIRVLDFSHVFQGPVGTQLLADFGADVIKLERPGQGDWSRDWGPYVREVSMPFAGLNRNKRSITLDLRQEAAKKIALQLAQRADVLVHNFRPGVMERLGLGYAGLSQQNPRLVYAYSSGWGDQGPYVDRGRPGHDVLARAEAGWFVAIDDDKLPLPGGISVDYPAGLMLMIGILTALVAREQTGQGQLVTTDLFSVALHAHSWDGVELLNRERLDRKSGIGVTEQAIDKAFRTRDGLLEISRNAFCEKTGDSSSKPSRVRNALSIACSVTPTPLFRSRRSLFSNSTPSQEWACKATLNKSVVTSCPRPVCSRATRAVKMPIINIKPAG